MDSGKTAAAIIAIVIVCTAIGAVVIMNIHGTNGEYSIEYELNGGTLEDGAPTSYVSGRITELGSAERTIEGTDDEYTFLGWYLDKELTENIMYIPSKMTGDLKLYASWSKDGSGAQEFFDTKTVTKENTIFGMRTTTTTGTYDRTLLTYSEEKERYLEMVSYTTKDSFGRESGNTVTRWQELIDTDQKEITPVATTLNMDGRSIPCESVSFTYKAGNTYNVTETRYFIYGWAMVYSEANYVTNGRTITEIFVLKSLGAYQSKDSYEIKAYCDEGIAVTNGGVHDAFSANISLTATADDSHTFGGWYDSAGNLLSNDNVYTVDLLMSDLTVYARNTDEYDVMIEKGKSTTFEENGLNDVRWTMYDSNGEVVNVTEGNSVTYDFNDYGPFTMTYSGTNKEGAKEYNFFGILVDGTVVRSYSWEYNGIKYEYDLNISYYDFNRYRTDSSVGRSAQAYNQRTIQNTQKLITSDDKYVVELAEMIKEKTAGMSEYDRINMLLAFTQYIEYKYDADSMGTEEYWKYPLETLYDNNGDCEDTSILFAAIGKAMDYDTAVILFPGHASGAINFENLGMSDSEYEIPLPTRYGNFFNNKDVYTINYYGKTQYLYVDNNTGYLYCETTTPDNGNGLKFVVGVDPFAGNSTRDPVNETYSPYNMSLLIPAADVDESD